MKIRWKRINRGILLAAVLIAGLAVYVIADKAVFNRSRDEIVSLAERYLQEQYQKETGDYAEREQGLEELVKAYWTDRKLPGAENGKSMTALLDEMRKQKETEMPGGSVQKAQGMLRQTSVSRNSPFSALIQVEAEETYEIDGPCVLFLGGGFRNVTAEELQAYGWEEGKTVSLTCQVNYVLEACDTGSGWKINALVSAGWQDLSGEEV